MVFDGTNLSDGQIAKLQDSVDEVFGGNFHGLIVRIGRENGLVLVRISDWDFAVVVAWFVSGFMYGQV